MFSFIKRYQSGGLIDTAAMKSDIKENSSFFKDGDYTAAGRKRLAAIQSIEDNQAKGLLYQVNDEAETFKIVDRLGKEYHDIEGRGMALNEGKSPLYGVFGRSNMAKKEISKVMGSASQYYLKPKTVEPKEETKPEIESVGEDLPIPSKPEVTGEKKVVKKETNPKVEDKTFKANIPQVGVSNRGLSPTDLLNRKKATGVSTGLTEYNQTQNGGPQDIPSGGNTDASLVGLPESWKDYGVKLDKNVNSILRTVRNDSVGNAGGFASYREDWAVNRISELEDVLSDRIKNGGKANIKSKLVIDVDGKEVSIAKATNEQIKQEIETTRERNKKTFSNQVDVTTQEALAYIDSEIDRLKETPWNDIMEKKQVLDALVAKKKNLVKKYDQVMSDPTMSTFKAFYGGDLPANSYQSYWDPNQKKIVKQPVKTSLDDGFNNVGIKVDKANTNIKHTQAPNALTPEQKEVYKSAISNRKYNTYRLYDGTKITNEQLLSLLDKAKTEKDLEQIYFPISESYGAYSNLVPLSKLKVKPDGTYSYDFNSIISTKGFKLPQFYFQKGGVLDIIKKKEDMKLVPKNAVPKAQMGTWDWNNLMKSISSLGNRGSDKPMMATDEYPSVYTFDKKKPTQEELDAKKQGELLASGQVGNTGSYMETRNAGAVNPTDTRIAQAEEEALNKSKTGLEGSVHPDAGSEDDMQAKKKDKAYYQEDTKVRRNKGPIFSTTGINTPVGQIQYGDIAQFLLMLKARNQKVDEVPVNLKKFVDTGSRDVLAARDLEAATMNDAQNKISQIRSQYAGSDPVMSAIMANQAASQQREAQATLDTARGQYRRQEDDRVAAQMEEKRQQMAANLREKTAAENENQERLYQAELAKAQDKARRETEFMNNIGGLINNMQTRANAQAAADKDYQTKLRVVEQQNKVAAAQKDYQSLLDLRTNADYGLVQLTPEQRQELELRIDKAKSELNALSSVDMNQATQEADEINRGRSIWRWRKPSGNTYK